MKFGLSITHSMMHVLVLTGSLNSSVLQPVVLRESFHVISSTKSYIEQIKSNG